MYYESDVEYHRGELWKESRETTNCIRGKFRKRFSDLRVDRNNYQAD